MAIGEMNKAYRDGSQSSTALLDAAMRESGAAEKSETLEWQHDPQTLDEARKQAHDEPSAVAGKAVEKLADTAAWRLGLAGVRRAGGETLASTIEFVRNPLSPIKKPVMARVANVAKAAVGAVGVAETAMIGAGVATIGAAVRNVELGDKLREASDVVAMDLAATSLLDLDPSYQASVYRHYEGSIAPDSVMRLFKNADGTPTPYGRENLPKLQAACDAGRNAALHAVYVDDPKAFVDANPKIKDRIAKDVAFSKGWDEVMHLKDQPGAAAKLETIERRIKARDGWSSAQSLPVRA